MPDPIPGMGDQALSPTFPNVPEHLRDRIEKFSSLLEKCDGEVSGSNEYAKQLMEEDNKLHQWLTDLESDTSSGSFEPKQLSAAKIRLLLGKIIRGEDMLHPMLKVGPSKDEDKQKAASLQPGERDEDWIKRVIGEIGNLNPTTLSKLINIYQSNLLYAEVGSRHSELGEARNNWLKKFREVTGHNFSEYPDPINNLPEEARQRIATHLGYNDIQRPVPYQWSEHNERDYQDHILLFHEIDPVSNLIYNELRYPVPEDSK